MGEKFKNVVCKPKDFFDDKKRQIFELINLQNTICNNLPDLTIPNRIPDVPDLNPSQKIIDLLADILSLVSGINFDEMKMQIVNWLVENLEPLSEELSVNVFESIKSCYACKVNPKIPEWMFQTQPSSGAEGIGINIELSKIDLNCIFASSPNDEIGKLFYDGNSTNDINAFLYEVIQKDGDPLIWSDPDSGKQIIEVRYYENNPIAYVENDGTVDFQNSEQRQRVFNIRIVNTTYQNKTLIDVLVDYFNSQQPLFDSKKVIPKVVDLIYGTLTNKIKLSDTCLVKIQELEESLDEYIDKGIDNPEITFDDSFYEFDSVQLMNIKEKVKQKKVGVKKYRKCCGTETSSISFDTLLNIENELENSSTLQEKIEVYSKSLEKVIDESANNVKNLDKDAAKGEFLSNFITSLQIALTKIVLSPKNLLMLNLFYYLVNSKPVVEVSIKKILKEYECVIRDIISEIIRKLIYDFLLPLVIQRLKRIILCVITKKLKEKHLNFLKSKRSLLPPFINEKLEQLNELFGKAEGAVDAARGFTDKINLDSLNNTNSLFNKKSRFCDT